MNWSRRSVRVVSWLELWGGVSGVYVVWRAWESAPQAMLLLFAVLSLASASAGWLLGRRAKLGIVLSIAVQACQLVAIRVPGAHYLVSCGFSLFVGLNNVGDVLLDSELGSRFALGTTVGSEPWVKLNLAAVAAVWVLTKRRGEDPP